MNTKIQMNDIDLIYEREIDVLSKLDYPWDTMEGKTILISGGTGLIGSLLIAVFRVRNLYFHQKIHVVSLSRHCGENNETVTYCPVDIREPFNIPGQIDYCIHLASNTHPKQYEEDPIGTIETNFLGCRNLLNLSVKQGVSRFVLASSVEIYGDGNEIPMAETFCGKIDCNHVRSGYNESKRLCESLVQAFRKQYGLDGVIARFSRCFGYTNRHDTKAIAQFLDRAVRGEDIVLRSSGTQRFSYCYVADAVSALLKILLCGKDGEAYNISEDDEGKTLADYASLIASFAHKKVVFDLNPKRNLGVSKVDYAVMDCEKLKALGWSPLWNVSEGLYQTYLKYKK